ncbi:MAG: hypothetical protein E6850_09140 [Leclercia adecarboxylata]|nr:hypothetical protein [Leclercia adecarboxylata]
MTSNVTSLGKEKSFPAAGELFERIDNIILEYEGEIGLAEAIGVLEMLKAKLLSNQNPT